MLSIYGGTRFTERQRQVVQEHRLAARLRRQVDPRQAAAGPTALGRRHALDRRIDGVISALSDAHSRQG